VHDVHIASDRPFYVFGDCVVEKGKALSTSGAVSLTPQPTRSAS
jgi:hypothetical protein